MSLSLEWKLALAVMLASLGVTAGCRSSRPPVNAGEVASGEPGTAWAGSTEGTDGLPAASLGGGAHDGAGGDAAGRLRWPLAYVQVLSGFGPRSGRNHEGIDLVAPTGTTVLAAAPGDVVYSGNRIRGYGNMVVLRHDGDLMTVYAHNSVLLVKVGDHVEVGQPVALSGQSGRATGPHLHFEVRRGQVPRDPMRFLPLKP